MDYVIYCPQRPYEVNNYYLIFQGTGKIRAEQEFKCTSFFLLSHRKA